MANDSSDSSSRLSRRQLISVASAAGLAAAGVIALEGTSLGQSSPPNATPSSGVPAPAATPISLGDPIPPEFDEPTNWPFELGDLKGHRATTETSISTDTISQLGTAWTLPLDVPGSAGAVTASPAIVGDTLYLQDMQNNVWSINKETGDVNWKTEYNIATQGPNGVAVGYGLVFGALGNKADVFALDAATGKETWRITLSAKEGDSILMSPLVYDSTVYVSTTPGSLESIYQGGTRGIIFAIDASTGNVLWTFDTTTDNLWGNARINSGGGLWHPPTVDDDGNIYVGTGNPAPWPGTPEFPNGSSRPGDNDYTNCLIKIDPDTGSVVWYINVIPHDIIDHDNQLSPVLATVSLDGTDTNIAIASGKHGFVVAANADTGEELWRTAVGKHQNDDVTELPTDSYVEIYPGVLGGVETPLAYADGIVFAPVLNFATGFNATGLDFSSFANGYGSATGNLVALDAATGEILWDNEQPTGTVGGAVVANDVVFTGGLDGVVHGYNTKDGSEVFTYQTTAGLNAPFAISGDYLYIPSGGAFTPSSDTWNPAPESAAQLIALKIGGEVQTIPAGTTVGTPVATPAS
jgi:outer membrane protein assembly factor BamB